MELNEVVEALGQDEKIGFKHTTDDGTKISGLIHPLSHSGWCEVLVEIPKKQEPNWKQAKQVMAPLVEHMLKGMDLNTNRGRPIKWTREGWSALDSCPKHIFSCKVRRAPQ